LYFSDVFESGQLEVPLGRRGQWRGFYLRGILYRYAYYGILSSFVIYTDRYIPLSPLLFHHPPQISALQEAKERAKERVKARGVQGRVKERVKVKARAKARVKEKARVKVARARAIDINVSKRTGVGGGRD
jgi:hypothetical protein